MKKSDYNEHVVYNILEQGHVEICGEYGYSLKYGEGCACFYLDVGEQAYIEASTTSDVNCPVLYISTFNGLEERYTKIEFPNFVGWELHASRGGKTLSIALIKH